MIVTAAIEIPIQRDPEEGGKTLARTLHQTFYYDPAVPDFSLRMALRYVIRSSAPAERNVGARQTSLLLSASIFSIKIA